MAELLVMASNELTVSSLSPHIAWIYEQPVKLAGLLALILLTLFLSHVKESWISKHEESFKATWIIKQLSINRYWSSNLIFFQLFLGKKKYLKAHLAKSLNKHLTWIFIFHIRLHFSPVRSMLFPLLPKTLITFFTFL